VSLDEVLGKIAGVLEGAEVPYMLTGSMAAAYYVTPRSTRDIDVVIEVLPKQLRAIVNGLRRLGWYVDGAAAEEARRTHGLFNAIDAASGWKVDFIVRKDRPYSRTKFARRRPGTVAQLLARQGGALDRAYIERWVRDLGLEVEWRRALSAQPST